MKHEAAPAAEHHSPDDRPVDDARPAPDPDPDTQTDAQADQVDLADDSGDAPREPRAHQDQPHPAAHQAQRLVSAGWARFILPVLCLLIAVASMVYVFTDQITFARDDLLGPLQVPEVILMIGIGGFVLSGVTLLLAVMPDPGPVVEAIEITREVEQAFPADTTPGEISQVLRGGGTIPTTEVLDALAECVTRVNRDLEVATARTLNEASRAQAAHRRAEEAEARIQGILDGTSDEGAALYRDISDSVARAFQMERTEHEASTERLVESLKAAKQRSDTDAAQARQRLAEIEAAALTARRDILREEYRKIQVAIAAVSQAVSDDYPDQAPVVLAHLERLRATLERLSPQDPAVDQDSATPQIPTAFLEAAGSKTWTPGPPIVSTAPTKPSKPSRKRLRGRKKGIGTSNPDATSHD